MRLRIFDWATRKFWVVALWEDRTLRVSFYGPAHDTWFYCWKWEDKQTGSGPTLSSTQHLHHVDMDTALNYCGATTQPVPQQDALGALNSFADTQGLGGAQAGSSQVSGAIVNPLPRPRPMLSLRPDGLWEFDGDEWRKISSTLTGTDQPGVREFKIPANASAPPVAAPDRVLHFNADDWLDRLPE